MNSEHKFKKVFFFCKIGLFFFASSVSAKYTHWYSYCNTRAPRPTYQDKLKFNFAKGQQTNAQRLNTKFYVDDYVDDNAA